MGIDKTTIKIENDEYVVERNHDCKSIGIKEPLVNVDPSMSVEPAICFDEKGKPILTDTGELPVLMPRTLHIPKNKSFQKVLEYADGLKRKERECPACRRISDKIKKGEVKLPKDADKKVEEYKPLFRNFPMLEQWRPKLIFK